MWFKQALLSFQKKKKKLLQIQMHYGVKNKNGKEPNEGCHFMSNLVIKFDRNECISYAQFWSDKSPITRERKQRKNDQKHLTKFYEQWIVFGNREATSGPYWFRISYLNSKQEAKCQKQMTFLNHPKEGD